MYLFFDTNAVGFPKSWNKPASDTFNWPRMTQLAWLIINEDKKPVAIKSYLIQPEGFEIPAETENYNGISTAIAKEKGVPLEQALKEFAAAINENKYLIAHNLNFDQKVVGAEFIRKNIPNRLEHMESICVMQEGTYICKLKGKGGKLKWPTLSELYLELFKKKLLESQDATTDVKATAATFFALVDLDEIDLF
ncbi:MAG: 3'-5' exonuclease [Saprospiraceae bacterium]